MIKPLLEGILTGLFLQLALGPIFFYILGITADSGYVNALWAIAAVTLADYIYIVLSLIGIGQFLKKNRFKTVFEFISSLMLLLFGLMLVYKSIIFINEPGHPHTLIRTPLNSFISCFILTISSPFTIILWSSVFSAKAMEKNYQKKELAMFGLGTGSATFIFLSVTMMGFYMIKSGISDTIVQILNCIVGIILTSYGITRAKKTAGSRSERRQYRKTSQ